MLMIFTLFLLIESRGPRTIHIEPNSDGDCFETPCAIKTATLVVRAADTVIFHSNPSSSSSFSSSYIRPTSYPSEFSDLFIQLTLMNTTVISKENTIIDGKFLAGEMLFQITSHPVFTWSLFHNWTFTHFSKPIAKRQYTWSTGPFLIFRDCNFEDSIADLFVLKGGTIFFENCRFHNISGRIIKSVSEARIDFVDCTFDSCSALFFHGSDASFVNCKFNKMNGQRGGAIYAAKTTLFVDHCVFANCFAELYGGAIYIRDSQAIFESEIKNSCFLQTVAQNGTAIYAYMSHLEVIDNCFTSNSQSGSDLIEKMVVNIAGDVIIRNDAIFAGVKEVGKCNECLKQPPAEVVQNDYTPVDTNKWFQFDDLKPGMTIEINDDDDDL